MVALMMSGILSLGTLVLEVGRYQAAKTQLNDANISAGTSMLANYDSVLYSRYGLLAIDDKLATEGRYRDYLEFNSDLAAGYKGNNISTLYHLDSSEMEGIYNLTSPAVLKRQILSRAKFKIVHSDYALNYFNMDYFLEDLQNKAVSVSDSLKYSASGSASKGSLSDISSDMQTALTNMYTMFSSIKKYDEGYKVTLDSASVSLLPSVTGTKYDTLHSEDISAINASVSDANSVIGSLGSMLTSGGEATYSETDVSVNVDFISDFLYDLDDLNWLSANAKSIVSDCRTMLQGINAAINVLKGDKQGNLLLNSYIAGFFSNKTTAIETYSGPAKGSTTMSNANFSGACTEYVFEGDREEINNQQVAYDYVMAMRLVTNLYSVIQSSRSFSSSNATNVAAHIAWAYYETFADTELLFRYGATVPFAKYNMILPIDNPAAVANAFTSEDFVGAMNALGVVKGNKFEIEGADEANYRDALALALWIVPNTEKIMRVADLIQLEMRYRQSYVEKTSVTFLMSEKNTFCRVKCTAKMNSVLPVISIDPGKGVNGASIQNVRYIGY